MDEQNPDSRKKRRIAPSNLTTTRPTESREAESAVPHRTLNSDPPTQLGAWDFLAKWNATDDAIIGGIDEEEYYSDVSDESHAALEAAEYESEDGDDVPREGTAARPSKLGTEKVTEIINESIEKYANAWTPGKDEKMRKDETGQAEVPVIYDALALWEEAEAAGERVQLAERYGLEAEYYRQRLDKLCDEISKDAGDTIAGVRKASVFADSFLRFTNDANQQCRNLEGTVEMLERATWLEEIYKLPPDTGSGDEAPDRIAFSLDNTQAPGAWSTASGQHGNSYPQFIDLGEPSDSEISEAERPLPVKRSTTPARVKSCNKREQIIPDGRLNSDYILVPSIETVGPAPVASPLLAERSRALLSDAPESASFSTVSRWSWAQLEETQDRKRIVSKAICELKTTDRDVIRERLQKVGRASIVREIPACVDMLLRGDKRMPGILPQDLPKILNFTRLFLCWWLCGNYTQKEPSEVDLADLKDCLLNRSLDPSTFCDYVDTLLGTTLSEAALKCPTQPSQAEIIEISDDEEPSSQLPHRRKWDTHKPEILRATITID